MPQRLQLKIDDSGVFVDVCDAHNMPITILSADVDVLVALAEEALKRTGEAEVDACCLANLLSGDLRRVSVKIFDLQSQTPEIRCLCSAVRLREFVGLDGVTKGNK